jgi:hypothetical protein
MKTRPIPSLIRRMFQRLDLLKAVAGVALFAVAMPAARAQTNVGAIQNPQNGSAADKIRAECIQGRRTICGRILKVLPGGLVVESGYTNLLRPPLDRSWLVPGTVQAAREPNLVEANEPGCVCVGLVFLTDIPKSRAAKPKPYDYVVIQGYPAGQYTYTSVGTTQRTVRRFSAILQSAILVNCDAAGINKPELN